MKCICTQLTDDVDEAAAWDKIIEEQEQLFADRRPSYTPDFRPGYRLWFLYGLMIRLPMLRVWSWLQHSCYVRPADIKPWESGTYVDRFPWAKTLKEWIGHSRWVPYWVRRELFWGGSYDCPWCGDESWIDYDFDPGERRPKFECVSSGPVGGEYTGEWWAGWLWCLRCGHYAWYEDQSV